MSGIKKRADDSDVAVIAKKKKPIEEKSTLFNYADLPNEILFKIFAYLNMKDLGKIARCLKK